MSEIDSETRVFKGDIIECTSKDDHGKDVTTRWMFDELHKHESDGNYYIYGYGLDDRDHSWNHRWQHHNRSVICDYGQRIRVLRAPQKQATTDQKEYKE